MEPGEQVLILLPTESNKLLAQWQGPYRVVRKIGKVDYLINLHDRRKKRRIYHINMLRKWHAPWSTGYLAEEVMDDNVTDDVDYFIP